jgi:hypothetical protein
VCPYTEIRKLYRIHTNRITQKIECYIIRNCKLNYSDISPHIKLSTDLCNSEIMSSNTAKNMDVFQLFYTALYPIYIFHSRLLRCYILTLYLTMSSAAWTIQGRMIYERIMDL